MKTALRLLLAPYRFSVANLFRMGEQGGVYYPDDPNSLLRRRNRLTYTQDFSNAVWLKARCTASPPSGGFTTVTEDASVSASHCWYRAAEAAPVGTYGVYTIRVKKSVTRNFALWVGSTANNPIDGFRRGINLSTGALMAPVIDGSGVVEVSTVVTEHDATTWLVTCVMQIATGGTAFGILHCLVNGLVTGNIFYTGDGTSSIQAGYAQLETYTTTPSAYQPVTDWNTEYMAAVGHLVTQFTDSAGTTPVTKVGDPVGLTLDRRFGLYRGPQLLTSGAIGLTGAATAATYSTTTGAGTVTRVDASNQSWVQFSGLTVGRSYQITVSGVSGGTLQVRDGSATGTVIASTTSGTPCLVTATGTTITLTASAAATVAFTVTQIQWLPGNHRIQATSGSRKTLSARVNMLLATATMATQNVTTVATSYKLSFTGTGTVTLTGTSTAGPLVGTGANDRVSLTFTPTAGTLTLTVSGSVTLADLRTADDAAKNIPAYQRVNTASDYDTDGFPFFWLFDGTDDSDATASTVDGSAYDKAVLIAGATKNSDAAIAVLVEHGIPAAADSMLMAPRTAAQPGFGADLRNGGLISNVPVASGFPAPVTAVFCVSMDKSAGTIPAQAIMRANGITRAPSPSGSGPVTGNFGDRTLYIGNRGGGGLPFNGREYATILRFGPMSDSERNQAERWVAQRMGVTI